MDEFFGKMMGAENRPRKWFVVMVALTSLGSIMLLIGYATGNLVCGAPIGVIMIIIGMGPYAWLYVPHWARRISDLFRQNAKPGITDHLDVFVGHK